MKNINFISLVKALVFFGAAVLIFIAHDAIIRLTEPLTRQITDGPDHTRLIIPKILIPTIYRIAIAVCLTEFLRLAIIAFYRPSNPSLKRDNFTIGISHLAKVLYLVLGGVLILSLFDISVKEAITTLSLIAAAVVLMTKDYIGNLINGMYMTFARVINIGDQVQIEEHKGRIMDITLTNVHLLNDDDDIIYIPNNKVFTSEIINYTRRELKKSSIDFEIPIEKLRDADWFQNEIISTLGELNSLIQPGTHNLKIQGIKHEYTSFKFQYILKDPLNKEDDKKVKRQVIRFIVKYLSNQLDQK
ncbi:MAG: mechanosensitive ion channel family protein [Flavobacteriales bacterium]